VFRCFLMCFHMFRCVFDVFLCFFDVSLMCFDVVPYVSMCFRCFSMFSMFFNVLLCLRDFPVLAQYIDRSPGGLSAGAVGLLLEPGFAPGSGQVAQGFRQSLQPRALNREP
jgi:hypothetical protein